MTINGKCDHALGLWDNYGILSLSYISSHDTQYKDADHPSGIIGGYAEWLDKGIFPHTRFRFCPRCGEKLDFAKVRRYVEKAEKELFP